MGPVKHVVVIVELKDGHGTATALRERRVWEPLAPVATSVENDILVDDFRTLWKGSSVVFKSAGAIAKNGGKGYHHEEEEEEEEEQDKKVAVVVEEKKENIIKKKNTERKVWKKEEANAANRRLTWSFMSPIMTSNLNSRLVESKKFHILMAKAGLCKCDDACVR